MNRLTIPFILTCLLLGTGIQAKQAVVYFGRDGIVHDKASAVASLVPYQAPNPAIKLADENVRYLGNGEFSVCRILVNKGADTVRFNDVLKVKDLFTATHYAIPCVSYNGNGFDGGETVADGRNLGKVKVPEGISCEGEPWKFSYLRTGVPSCTLTENAKDGLAVFAANDTHSSLVSSCSLERDSDGKLLHVIVRPVVEAPYTYEAKGVFGPRYGDCITLAPGGIFISTSYVCVCTPKWENYASISLLEHSLRLLNPQLDYCLDDDQVWNLASTYIRSLLFLYRDKWLTATNRKQRLFHDQHKVLISREEMAERQKWEYWTDIATFTPGFEMGWAGQNFLNARMLATQAFATSDDDLLEKAIGVYDAFIATQTECGLVHVRYQENFANDHVNKIAADVCNLGWGGAEAIRMYKLLKEHGIEKPEYVEFSRKLCDFFVNNWSDEWGFGKTWTIDGVLKKKPGSIGGFIIPALVETYTVTSDKKYLDMAEKASDWYYRRDLDKFVCTAGAIDCNCVDKETAYPFLQSSLDLYRITGKEIYLERAEKAAAYFCSWMFFFDGVFGPQTDFVKYNWHMTGGTAVSAEHQCMDMWGGIMAADLYDLTQLTGNPMWDRMGRLMWAHAIQGITTRLGEFFHDMQRPIGAQNEGFFQARYTKYRPIIEEGYWNDIFVAWPNSYRLWTLDRMHQKGVRFK